MQEDDDAAMAQAAPGRKTAGEQSEVHEDDGPDWGEAEETSVAKPGMETEVETALVGVLQVLQGELQKVTEKVTATAAEEIRMKLRRRQGTPDAERRSEQRAKTQSKLDMTLEEGIQFDNGKQDDFPTRATSQEYKVYDQSRAGQSKEYHKGGDVREVCTRQGNGADGGDTPLRIEPNKYTDIRERDPWTGYAPQEEEPIIRGDVPPGST